MLEKKATYPFETFFRRSWWLILFIICCYVFHELGLNQHTEDLQKLQHHYHELQKEKVLAKTEQEKLLLEINSQSDPEWVEMTLMDSLGVIREEQTKVLFTHRQELLRPRSEHTK